MNKRWKTVAFTLIAGVSMAMKFSNHSAMAKETKEYMLNICSTDSSCQTVVDTYFEQCFNTYASVGSRYTSASLDTKGLANCINQHGGVAYFTAE